MQPRYALIVPKQSMTSFYFEGGVPDCHELNNVALETQSTKGALWTVTSPTMLPWRQSLPRYALSVPKQSVTGFYFEGGALDCCEPINASLEMESTNVPKGPAITAQLGY
eukprot:12664497-Ditylum_brightwellii.AAC.1